MAKKSKDIVEEIKVPDGIEAKLDGFIFTVKGPAGESAKKLFGQGVGICLKEGKVIISAKSSKKKEKKLVGTLRAHVNNMLRGAVEQHKYLLKVCSGHFPMKVSVEGNKFIVKNFLGEKFPRTLVLKPKVTVKVEGDIIDVQSCSKDLAGQTATDIEKLTQRPNYDTRIFQDGIYITNKDGKDIK